MAKKLLLGIFVTFFILVGFNYLLTLAGDFFSGRGYGYGPAFARGPFFDPGPGSGHALAAVHFDLFGKGGDGPSYITQGYGRTPYSYEYPDNWHDGIDIAAFYGAPVHSPAAGTVLATGNQDDYCYRRGFGGYVALYDPANNLVLWFAHLGAIAVSTGEKVAKGALLGAVGATGFETGAHLHFSVFRGAGFSLAGVPGCGPGPTAGDRDLNPLSYLGTIYQ